MAGLKDLSDSEVKLVEAYRAAAEGDSDMSARQLALADQLAEEGFTREYLLEASMDALEAIAEVFLEGFAAGGSANPTANAGGVGLDELDVGTGMIGDIDGA